MCLYHLCKAGDNNLPIASVGTNAREAGGLWFHVCHFLSTFTTCFSIYQVKIPLFLLIKNPGVPEEGFLTSVPSVCGSFISSHSRGL
jgi:hypothetical protein